MPPTKPTLMLHGFTQTEHSWGPFADVLVDRHAPLETLEMATLPGHGRSPRHADNLWAAATLVAPSTPSVVVGYSMGARLALHVALAHPGMVTGLVLISGTPGVSDPDRRRDRRESDAALARRIEQIGVEEFLAEWMAQPLFAGLPQDRASWADRLENTSSGLADALVHLGTGSQDDLRPQLGELTMPTLVIVGAGDHKFCGLGAEMVAGIGDSAEMAVVADAGHAVHLESPERTAAVLSDWLERIARR